MMALAQSAENGGVVRHSWLASAKFMLPSKTFYVLRSRSHGRRGSFAVAGLDVQKCHGGSFSEPSRWHRKRLAIIFGRLTQTQPAPAAVPRTLRPGLSFSRLSWRPLLWGHSKAAS